MPTVLLAVLLIVVVAVVAVASVQVMREYERAVVFRLGRLLQPPRGPGLILLIPVIDRMIRVDLRTVALEVPPQDVITRDNVPVTVTAVVYFRVVHPSASVVQVENYTEAASQIAQTTLRSILGQHELNDILAERDRINSELQTIIDKQTESWGVKVSVVEVKDVELPQTMQRAIARVAEAQREKRARVISAEAEFEAAAELKAAANIIAESPIALQLRYLQTLLEASSSDNTTTILPVPMELLRPFAAAAQGSLPHLSDGNGHAPAG
jgi:regulator of protease activity HflC (stomatin/prohibitin superfamily)